LRGARRKFWREDSAAQLVEFAVSLPLLVVFVVGIFDFSGAFTLKQKLTNIARDAARAAAAAPANDLTNPGLPVSVNDAFQLIDGYLVANKISDCGANLGTSINGPATTWNFTGTTGCPPGGLTIYINRGYYFPQTGATLPSANCGSQTPGGQTAMIATCVSIKYGYQWRFGRAASLLGFTDALPTTITAAAVALNED
jgi:Flp pilus assembly protein TadG